jgi:hypothetical protein
MVDGSVGDEECGFHAFTVPSDEAETTRESITIRFENRMLERTCLIIVAEEDIVDPICVNLCRLSKLRRLVQG